jgi:hypothetical protein
MNKKETLIPFAFMALSLLFIIVCAMVYLSGGKSNKWITRKMRIGGLLLTMTTFSCNGSRHVKCYDAVPLNFMSLKNTGENAIEINIDTNNVMLGTISGRHGSNFSFSIIDKSGKAIQKDFVLPVDSGFDAAYEDFKFAIDKKISEGQYELKFYASSPVEQDSIQAQNEFKLIIKHE